VLLPAGAPDPAVASRKKMLAGSLPLAADAKGEGGVSSQLETMVTVIRVGAT
jgi:hypothetical protein